MATVNGAGNIPRRTILLALLLFSPAQLAIAQGPPAAGLHQVAAARQELESPKPQVHTEWKLGMIAGAAVGGILWAVSGPFYQDGGSPTVSFLVISVFVFSVIGGLIGSGIKRH